MSGDVLITLAMLVHIIQRVRQMKTRVQTRVTGSMKRTFLMHVRLGKDDMTMMIRKRGRRRSREMMLMMMMIRSTSPTIEFLT